MGLMKMEIIIFHFNVKCVLLNKSKVRNTYDPPGNTKAKVCPI